MMNEALNYSYSYADFLLREAYNQERMAVCINEAVMLSEGAPTTEFHVLHEGFTDKLKELWNKFVRFINKIWLKFKATFDRIMDNDRGWVEKYKTIITQRPLKLDISMTNYQATIISQTHAENFDPAKINTMLEGNVAYLKSIPGMPGEITKYNGSEDIEDIKTAIRLAFVGGSEDEQEVNKNTFNMTDVYNFVHDYNEKIVKEMGKDVTAISNSSSQFQKLLDELKNAQKAIDAKKATEGDGGTPKEGDKPKDGENPAAPGATKPEGGTPPSGPEQPQGTEGGSGKDHTGESALFINNSFLSLNETTTIGTSGNGSAGAGDVNKGGMAGGVNTQSNTKYSANANGLSGKAVDKDAVAKTAGGFTDEDITKATNTYSTINQAIVSIKQTVCQNMYRDYRDIIKAHIKSYVGETGEKTAGQQGTDYRNGQPQGTNGNPNPPEQQQGTGNGEVK